MVNLVEGLSELDYAHKKNPTFNRLTLLLKSDETRFQTVLIELVDFMTIYFTFERYLLSNFGINDRYIAQERQALQEEVEMVIGPFLCQRSDTLILQIQTLFQDHLRKVQLLFRDLEIATYTDIY